MPLDAAPVSLAPTTAAEEIAPWSHCGVRLWGCAWLSHEPRGWRRCLPQVLLVLELGLVLVLILVLRLPRHAVGGP